MSPAQRVALAKLIKRWLDRAILDLHGLAEDPVATEDVMQVLAQDLARYLDELIRPPTV